ncbi:unnamed protein product [Nesidiocoris tenuis]|uniref:Uncharacterized protein n=1 Tax=Nesidiocoris tenuis TaxID=355587 RepID=A0A6H5GNM4_9HEMI|nr:unnamed protein product [Nesidiocoris tenuis]
MQLPCITYLCCIFGCAVVPGAIAITEVLLVRNSGGLPPSTGDRRSTFYLQLISQRSIAFEVFEYRSNLKFELIGQTMEISNFTSWPPTSIKSTTPSIEFTLGHPRRPDPSGGTGGSPQESSRSDIPTYLLSLLDDTRAEGTGSRANRGSHAVLPTRAYWPVFISKFAGYLPAGGGLFKKKFQLRYFRRKREKRPSPPCHKPGQTPCGAIYRRTGFEFSLPRIVAVNLWGFSIREWKEQKYLQRAPFDRLLILDQQWRSVGAKMDSPFSLQVYLANFNYRLNGRESTIWLSPIFRAIPDINLKAINYFTRHLELRLTTMNDDLHRLVRGMHYHTHPERAENGGRTQTGPTWRFHRWRRILLLVDEGGSRSSLSFSNGLKRAARARPRRSFFFCNFDPALVDFLQSTYLGLLSRMTSASRQTSLAHIVVILAF